MNSYVQSVISTFWWWIISSLPTSQVNTVFRFSMVINWPSWRSWIDYSTSRRMAVWINRSIWRYSTKLPCSCRGLWRTSLRRMVRLLIIFWSYLVFGKKKLVTVIDRWRVNIIVEDPRRTLLNTLITSEFYENMRQNDVEDENTVVDEEEEEVRRMGE